MALADAMDHLARAPLFRLLEREAIRLIAFSAETRRLRPGEALFQAGDRSDGGYVVVEGELDIMARDGTQLAVAGPGSLVGQTALFVRMKRPATAKARALTVVLRISPTLMRRVLQEFPAGAATLHEALGRELQEMNADLDRVRQMLAPAGETKAPARP